MNSRQKNKVSEKGFLKAIVLIIIALALLKIVWDLDVINILSNPKIKEILDILFDIIKSILEFLKNLFGSLRN